MAAQPQAVQALTEQEKKTVYLPAERWSDAFALKIARMDFEQAEAFRQQYHDSRFKTADEIYLAWCAQRTWEGTNKPRSSLGSFVALSQIESVLPRVISGIFADGPNYFEVDPTPAANAMDARYVHELMLQQMDEAGIREVFRRCRKDAFIYGNGPFEVCWDPSSEEHLQWIKEYIPVFRTVKSPFFGSQRVQVDRRPVYRQKKIVEYANRPQVKRISMKDYYPDPNCPSPIIQEGRFDCIRRYVTVDEMEKYREAPGFKIPESAALLEMAKRKPVASSDLSKKNVESIRGSSWNPEVDTSADPAAARLELVIYTTRDRIVWMLNREHIAFNEANPYGMINHFSFWYIDVPDRWYALSICDVVEGDQRFIQTLRNARIDELALALHPSTIKRQGLRIPQAQMRRRPGNFIEVPNPETDLIREPVSNITQNAYLEQSIAERAVEKTTGLSDLMQGLPAGAQGNATARTATGVGALERGGSSRIQYLVENDEDAVIEPFLRLWHKLNVLYLDPETIVQVLGEKVDPLLIKNARVKFMMRASAKMQSRAGLLQTFPLTSQLLFAPETQEILARQGKKLNYEEVFQIWFDAVGYRTRFSLIQDMTPQDMMAMQASKMPPEEMVRYQMQKDRLASQEGTADEKNAVELLKVFGNKYLPLGEGGEEAEPEE